MGKIYWIHLYTSENNKFQGPLAIFWSLSWAEASGIEIGYLCPWDPDNPWIPIENSFEMIWTVHFTPWSLLKWFEIGLSKFYRMIFWFPHFYGYFWVPWLFGTVATKIPKTLVSGSKSLGATGFRNLGTVHGQGVEQRMVEIYTKSWMFFVRENPNLKWMIAGGTPWIGHLHLTGIFFCWM